MLYLRRMEDSKDTSIIITKAGGEQEVFDPDKLRRSLRKAGAKQSHIEEIIQDIGDFLLKEKRSRSTHSIYTRAFKLLKKLENQPVAARYSLRRALADLGPSGFPFESFVGEIFKAKGYKVEIGQEVQGKCAVHEVDLIAYNHEKFIIGELKFHNRFRTKPDLKVALYVNARFRDLQDSLFQGKKEPHMKTEGWLITNTKFTKHSIDYSLCAGMRLVSWGYPEGESLRDIIEKTGLHPLTALTTLSRKRKHTLLKQGVVLCRSVEDEKEKFLALGISDSEFQRVANEAKRLCQSATD